jgi:hypothetical protein
VLYVLFGLPCIFMTSFVLRALEDVSKTNEMPAERLLIFQLISPLPLPL